MTFIRKSAGTNVTPSTVKRRASGAWVDVQTIKRRLSGAWVTVWTAIAATLSDKSVIGLGSATVAPRPFYEINADGNVYTGNAQVGVNTHTLFEQYVDSSHAASAYQVRATIQSGGPLFSGTTGTWLACSTTRQWIMQDTTQGNGSGVTVSLLIEIRDASSLVVLDSATVTITSTWNSGGAG